ncbi:MAG: C25 family cysteine peptidase, partial [Candidatus Stygibacter australis]|nr:C25 family cysteine peptidase [Candidatus Stygibacter australis]
MKAKNSLMIIILFLVTVQLYCINGTNDSHSQMFPVNTQADEVKQLVDVLQTSKHISRDNELRENRTLDTELIIITADSLESDFEELAELKTEEGIVTEIVTLTTMGTTSSAIRSWLATQKASNSNLQYVILGGDESIVPTHQIIYPHAGDTTTSSSDFYYSNVLSTWPQNDDEIMYIDTDIDIYVGRLPVRNSTEVEIYITKYENYRTNNTEFTDHMNFISTNVAKDHQYHIYDNIVREMMTHTGENIVCDSLLCADLVDTLNGAATAIVDKLQDRDYSFLYGNWHGIDRFVIFDSQYNKHFPWSWLNYSNHMQQITINSNIVEEGSCYYVEGSGAHEGEWQYYYTTPSYAFLQLEDILPQTYGNTYVMWMSSCMTMDMNFVSSSMPCARDSNNVIIQNSNIYGWLEDVYVESEPQPIINEENCINEVFFNQIGGPVAIYASSAIDYPNITNSIVNEFLDLIFIENENKLGYLTNTAWELYDHAFDLYLYRFLFIGYTLFGDPSMDVWSAEAKQLVLSENIEYSPFGSTPTFEVYDTEGNFVEALVCVIDDEGVIQGKGLSPYNYNAAIADDWIITANKANYLQDRREYEYLKSYSTVPYIMDFENGLDKNWRIYPDSTYGRILVTSENDPYNGDMHLTMDSNTTGQYATNSAELHLNLTDKNRIILDFYWKDIADETNAEDGVYISDDNGSSYVKIDSLCDGSGWEHIVIDLDTVIAAESMEYNKNFIIKFQQRDNCPISSDGFAFDDIQVYSM